MSNKKKKKKNLAEQKAEKYLSYGTLIGLVAGLIIGTIAFLLTDNMFWMALAPIILLFIGHYLFQQIIQQIILEFQHT